VLNLLPAIEIVGIFPFQYAIVPALLPYERAAPVKLLLALLHPAAAFLNPAGFPDFAPVTVESPLQRGTVRCLLLFAQFAVVPILLVAGADTGPVADARAEYVGIGIQR
jgi:hypothetical protein